MTTERNYEMTVADVMTGAPDYVKPSTTVREAAEMMRNSDVGALPVVSDGQVVGMLTDRDIVIQAVARGLDPNVTNVGPIATAGIVIGTPDMTVLQAAELMAARQVRRLPIMDGGRLAGMVSMQDLAQYCPPHLTGATEQAITSDTAQANAPMV